MPLNTVTRDDKMNVTNFMAKGLKGECKSSYRKWLTYATLSCTRRCIFCASHAYPLCPPPTRAKQRWGGYTFTTKELKPYSDEV
jgi:hypothetical protein